MQQNEEKKLWCKYKSVVKLAITDQFDNITYKYSLFFQERKLGYNREAIAEGMKARLLDKVSRPNYKVAIFYNNQTKEEMFRVSNRPQKEVSSRSKIKLLVWDAYGHQYIEESSKMEDKGSIDFIVGAMLTRVCEVKLKNKYRTAMFIDQINDKPIAYHNPRDGFYQK